LWLKRKVDYIKALAKRVDLWGNEAVEAYMERSGRFIKRTAQTIKEQYEAQVVD